ncbi:hypothetical protein RND81_12G123400 [Saponaria officinalis]|uniref:Agenet domain-containing protein n=1 Tax=Saponaria officinalis TaxID=3572 RepID=A0AAW1H9N7_SAPOF
MAFPYTVGSRVEVTFPGSGFMVAFYVGEVICVVEDNVFYVKFDHLLDCDGDSPTREVVPIKQLRPLPPFAGRRRFVVGDVLEVFANDGWWVGSVVVDYEQHNCYDVLLNVTGDLVFAEICDIRFHQAWDGVKWIVVLD